MLRLQRTLATATRPVDWSSARRTSTVHWSLRIVDYASTFHPGFMIPPTNYPNLDLPSTNLETTCIVSDTTGCFACLTLCFAFVFVSFLHPKSILNYLNLVLG